MQEAPNDTQPRSENAGLLGTAEMAQLVREHTAILVGFARSRLNDPDLAEDLVQQTFLAAWQGRAGFAGDSSPRTWLFRILKNKIADHYRKQYREPTRTSMDPEMVERFDGNGRWLPEHRPTDWRTDEVDDKEVMFAVLAHCLEKLPENWRAAVEMKYLKDRDAKAICKELGISATHYWQQIHRAKVRMRSCMESRIREQQH